MTELTPGQRRARERIEVLIGAAAPALDLLLGAGDRLSRMVEHEDHDDFPVRAAGEPALLEPGQSHPTRTESSEA